MINDTEVPVVVEFEFIVEVQEISMISPRQDVGH